MGKKSKKKTGTASAGYATTSNPMPVAATVANASPTMDEIMEPIAKFDLDLWEASFPFAEKTSDPMAKDLDYAHKLFLMGLQHAKNNDLSLASEYIASAYVRDIRAVIVTKEAAEKVLDFETYQNLIQHGMCSTPSLSAGILFLIMALSEAAVQTSVGIAMKCITSMLETITEDMLKSSFLGQLGGLTLAKGYYLRGRLYTKIGNGRSALKDWTKAIKLDPSFVPARFERLHHWFSLAMKTLPDLHAECVLVLGLVHDDYSELDVIYAILAFTTFKDFRLGTFTDAMEYYRKSLEATSRRVEVYGARFVPHGTTHYVRSLLKMAYEDPNTELSQERKSLDGDAMAVTPAVEQFLDQDVYGKVKRNRCLNCSKHEANDGIQLSKCGRCKRVYYCSKECSHAVSFSIIFKTNVNRTLFGAILSAHSIFCFFQQNWKEHKLFCNEISGHTAQKI